MKQRLADNPDPSEPWQFIVDNEACTDSETEHLLFVWVNFVSYLDDPEAEFQGDICRVVTAVTEAVTAHITGQTPASMVSRKVENWVKYILVDVDDDDTEYFVETDESKAIKLNKCFDTM